jgi:heme-degrading monooxygenase HmoA
MYARVVTGHVPPAKLDEVVQLWKTEVAPSVQQQRGFVNVRLMVDRAAGKIKTMGLWESEDDFKATVAWNQGQIDKFASYFSTPPTVEGYEFVIELGRPATMAT